MQGFAQSTQPPFACMVGASVGPGAQRSRRGDVYYLTAAALVGFAQHGQASLDQKKGAKEIGVHDARPLFWRDVLHGSGVIRARIVDKHIQAAPLTSDGTHGPFGCAGKADIATQCQRAMTLRIDLMGHLCGFVCIQVGKYHASASLHQLLRNGCPEATGCPGHQDYLVFESIHDLKRLVATPALWQSLFLQPWAGTAIASSLTMSFAEIFQGEWWRTALQLVLLRVGDVTISVGSLLKLLLFMSLLFWLAGGMRRWLAGRLLGHFDVDEGTRIAIASVLRYLVLILGMVLILQNVGINLSALGVVAGAVGVGVGFGLQNIVSNFISGLIVMLERPIKVGDRIEVGSVQGVVREISARHTTLVNSDNVAILVPNQRFIVENVVNAAYLQEPVRLRVAVTLAADTDPLLLDRLLLELVHAHSQLLETPTPEILLSSADGSSRQFEFAVWFHPDNIAREQLASEIRLDLEMAFAAHGVRHA